MLKNMLEGRWKGKKSQKGESFSGKAHIAEEEQEKVEEETLFKKKKTKKEKKKKKQKPQRVASAAREEGFAYSVRHFDPPGYLQY